MGARSRGVRNIAELMRVIGRGEPFGEDAGEGDDNEKNNCRQARPLHASLLRKAPPNRSEAEFAAIVTTVTIMVKLISRYKSRPKAAFQANCPIPGRSQRTSTGIEAPKARLTETPARARGGPPPGGKACQKERHV